MSLFINMIHTTLCAFFRATFVSEQVWTACPHIFLIEAQSLGYRVNLVFIHLAGSDLNRLRVSQRVSEGGHAVPAEKIVNRIPRTLALMKQAIQQADYSLLLDNSSYDDPFKTVAVRKGREIRAYAELLPEWAVEALSLPR